MRPSPRTWLAAGLMATASLPPAVEAQASTGTSTSSLSKLSTVPRCALSCMYTMVKTTDCQLTDLNCLCNSKLFEANTAACIKLKCTIKETLMAVNATQTTCQRPTRDAAPKFLTIAIFFSILSALFVFQRFLVKIFAANLYIGVDDWVILLAIAVEIPFVAIACEGGLASGMGKDIWTLTPRQITDFGYYLYIFSTLYFTNIAICKLAFLFFYLRVFPNPRVRRVLWGTISFICIWAAVFVTVSVFQCRPISYYWLRWDGEHDGTCVNASYVVWANAGMSIVLDLWMIGIPLSQLNGLSLDKKKKLGVGAMFCVGLFVTVVSIIRLSSLINHPWDSSNQTWVKMEVAIWSTIEVNVGIICACMPSLRSLLVRIFPRLSIWTSNDDGGAGGGRYQDFSERNLGFGTVTRSVVDRQSNVPMPPEPGAVAVHKTYAVEFGDRASYETDDARLKNKILLKSLSAER